MHGVGLGGLPAGLNVDGRLALLPGAGTRLAATDSQENAVLEADVP